MPSKPKEETKEPGVSLAPQPKVSNEVIPFDPSVMEDDAGRQQYGREDLTVARLRVLQGLSPQVIRGHAKFIPSASVGMFCNTVTQKLYDGEKGIQVIPVYYTPSYIEWMIREKSGQGSGFVKDHGATDPKFKTQMDDKSRARIIDPAGQMTDTYIQKSGDYYLFILDPDAPGEFDSAVYSMTGKQLAKSRDWNSKMKMLRAPKANGQGTFNPAPFYSVFKITTIPESNDKGNWMGVKIEPAGRTIDLPRGGDIYLKARALREAIEGGLVQVVRPDEEETVATPAQGSQTDDDLSF